MINLPLIVAASQKRPTSYCRGLVPQHHEMAAWRDGWMDGIDAIVRDGILLTDWMGAESGFIGRSFHLEISWQLYWTPIEIIHMNEHVLPNSVSSYILYLVQENKSIQPKLA
jgi:hypothetical protein